MYVSARATRCMCWCVSVSHTHSHTHLVALVESGHAKVIEKEKPSEAKFWLTLCAGTCHWLSGLWFVACHTEQTRYARWLSWLSIIIHKYANRLRAECAINSLKATRAWRAEDFWADWPQRERERETCLTLNLCGNSQSQTWAEAKAVASICHITSETN